MEISTCLSLISFGQRLLNAAPPPPAALGLLPDLVLERDQPMTPAALSADFTGAGLTYALAPGSAALPAGLSLSPEGLLSGTPTADVGPLAIVIRASNPQGSADSGFSVTVQEMLLDFTATLSGLTANTTHGPSAETGVAVTATASAFSGVTPGSFSYQWKTVESGDIAGATSASFTPNAALFDGERLFCEITPAGYPPKATNTAVIRYAAPTTSGNPGEQFWDVGTGAQFIDMSPFASGAVLNWSVMGQGASINAATGALEIRTDSQAIGAVAVVTALNSGGAVSIAFTFNIEDLAAGPGPELSALLLDDFTNTIGFTVDEPGTIYWRRDPSGTNADPGDVIGGGGFDSGSFPVIEGLNTADITFATGNDGPQEISFVAAAIASEPSLVRTAAIEIDTALPTLVSSSPAAGASGIDGSLPISLTFSEPVFAGAGTVSIYDVTGATTLETFTLPADLGTRDGDVEISGADVTLRPTVSLSNGRDFAVLIDPGALRDGAGNDFDGIASTGTLGFSTGGTAAVIDTDFDAAFPTALPGVWSSMQANPYNSAADHRAGETWDAYPASLTDGGVLAVKAGTYPQLRFAVPVEVGKTYAIDADFPVGEGSWDGPLRVKLGSAINANDYAQIDESQAGQPRVVEMRGQQFTATSTEAWFAIIVETGTSGGSGGNPAISMLRVTEV